MGFMPSRIWAQQPSIAPEIDWSNPLARGLSSLLWAGHGKAFDLLAPSEAITVTNAPVAASINGIGRQVTTAGSNGVFSARSGVPAAKIAALPLSFFFVGEIGTAAGSAPIAGYTSGTNGYLIHAAYGSRTRRIYCSGVSTESGTWSTGQGVFGIVANGSTLVGYDKGNQFASTACSSAPSYDSFSRYQMFGSSDTGAVTGTGLFQAVWARALSPAEVKSFSNNPWQIFKPLPSRIYPSVSAGGDASASGSVPPVSLSSSAGSANSSSVASSSIAALSLSAATGSASGTSASNGNSAGSVVAISLSSPSASANGSAQASSSVAYVSLSSVSGSAFATSGSTGSGDVDSIAISAATAIAVASSVASGGVQSIGITAPSGTASSASANGSASGVVDAISLFAPSGVGVNATYVRAPYGAGPSVISPSTRRVSNISEQARPANVTGKRG